MRFDAVIIGDGPAGSLTAFMLAKAGFNVALYTSRSSSFVDSRPGETLPSAAGHLLNDLGLRHLLKSQPPSFSNTSAWGGVDLQYNDSIRDPNGHGWHLDRATFDQALLEEARNAGVKMNRGSVNEIQWTDGAWHLNVGGAQVSTDWIVDATGRKSQVARMLGATRIIASRTVAITFSAPEAQAEVHSLIEAAKDGWWYTSAVPRGRRYFSFHTHVEFARRLIRGGTFEILRELRQTNFVSRHVNPATRELKIGFREAGSARLDQFVGAGWIAVGDAALSMDPLSSQGVFNALYSGRAAGLALIKHFAGDSLELRRYDSSMNEVWRIYEQRRLHYYGLETRWPESLFWRQLTGEVTAGNAVRS